MKAKYFSVLVAVFVVLFFSLCLSAEAQVKDKIRIGFSI